MSFFLQMYILTQSVFVFSTQSLGELPSSVTPTQSFFPTISQKTIANDIFSRLLMFCKSATYPIINNHSPSRERGQSGAQGDRRSQ